MHSCRRSIRVQYLHGQSRAYILRASCTASGNRHKQCQNLDSESLQAPETRRDTRCTRRNLAPEVQRVGGRGVLLDRLTIPPPLWLSTTLYRWNRQKATSQQYTFLLSNSSSYPCDLEQLVSRETPRRSRPVIPGSLPVNCVFGKLAHQRGERGDSPFAKKYTSAQATLSRVIFQGAFFNSCSEFIFASARYGYKTENFAHTLAV